MIMHSFALKYRHHPFTICLPFFIQFLGFLFTAWKDSKGLKVSAVIHHNCSWTKTVLNLSKSRYGMIWLQSHELIKCNFSLVTFSIQSYWDMLHSPVWWTAEDDTAMQKTSRTLADYPCLRLSVHIMCIMQITSLRHKRTQLAGKWGSLILMPEMCILKFAHNGCIPVLVISPLHHAWFVAKVAFLFGCYFPAVFVTPEQPDHKEPGSLLGFGHHCKKMQEAVLWCFVNFLHRIQWFSCWPHSIMPRVIMCFCMCVLDCGCDEDSDDRDYWNREHMVAIWHGWMKSDGVRSTENLVCLFGLKLNVWAVMKLAIHLSE